jgi:hypothetical protein
MNWKQIICMWLGVGLIVLVGWNFFIDFPARYSQVGICCRFGLWVFIAALVTGGLIVTFKDRKRPEVKQPINLTRGFKRVTLLLSLLSMLFFFIIGIAMLLHGDQHAPEPFAVGLASAAGVWVIYGVIRWIVVPFVCWVVKGFHEDTG